MMESVFTVRLTHVDESVSIHLRKQTLRTKVVDEITESIAACSASSSEIRSTEVAFIGATATDT